MKVAPFSRPPFDVKSPPTLVLMTKDGRPFRKAGHFTALFQSTDEIDLCSLPANTATATEITPPSGK